MAKLIASNTGIRTQAIKVRGGSLSLRPNATLPVEPYPDLDKDKISHFSSLGVTFSVPGEKPQITDVKGQKKAKRSQTSTVSDAEKIAAEKAAAEKAAAEKVDAMKAAEDAVLAAMAKLEQAGDDMVAKAAAEDELKAAEAALVALKA